MQRSTERILTTHVGSLPRPADLLGMVLADGGTAFDAPAGAARLRTAVSEIVQRQIALGIDIIDDGEFGKPSFVSYVNQRLGGCTVDTAPGQGPWAGSRDAQAFPEFYGEAHAAARAHHMVCTAPIVYTGRAQLARDIDNLKAAVGSAKPADVFMPAISPSNVEDWQTNAYYKTQEEFVFAIAEAMREEYRTIVDAGFILQIDDPRLVTYYMLRPAATIEECRKWAE